MQTTFLMDRRSGAADAPTTQRRERDRECRAERSAAARRARLHRLATAAAARVVLRVGRGFGRLARERLRRLRRRALLELRRVIAGVRIVVVERLPLDDAVGLALRLP